MKVSTTQFDLRKLTAPKDFWDRSMKLCQKASASGSEIIVFPEYMSLSWLLNLEKGSFANAISGFNKYKDEYLSRWSEIAKKFQLLIVAGTTPEMVASKTVNRSYIFSSQGDVWKQDKIHMTRFESEEWKIQSGGPTLKIFDCRGYKFAVCICYDIEFAQISNTLGREKVDFVCIPSCTDDEHGYWRVRLCAQARAVENQCYIVMSSIVGGQRKFPEISSHYGRGGIFTPCDVGAQKMGVQKQGVLNKEGVVSSPLDFSWLAKIRKSGTVINLTDQNKNKEA